MKPRFKIACLALVVMTLSMATYVMFIKDWRLSKEQGPMISLISYRRPHANINTSSLSQVKLSVMLSLPTAESVAASSMMQLPSTPSKIEPLRKTAQEEIEREDECSTVHVAMVATAPTEGIVLYDTLKSIFMHRSTPLHFHFIIDNQTKLIIGTILDSWLLPGVIKDYYFIDDMIVDSDTKCQQVPSVLLNLHTVLPNSVKRIIAIEPTSVVSLDLAMIRLVSEPYEEHPILTCGATCATYCLGGAKPQPVGFGTAVISLNTDRAAQCSMGPHNIDQLVLEALRDRNSTLSNERLCERVREFDGESLRHREEKKCPEHMKPIMATPPSRKDACAEFEWERNIKRREIPHILGNFYTPLDEYDITLSTQLSSTRLAFLERILKHWDGPASIAFHASESDISTILDFINKLKDRTNVIYHITFKVGIHYPFNVLREQSHKLVTTKYLFFLDIDFVPSPGLYQYMRKQLKDGVYGNTKKTAIIIPSFETFKNNSEIPPNKAQMVKLFQKGIFVQFHGKGNPQGQGATNYGKWKVATKPYSINWRGSFEPYAVVEKSAPPFPGQFIARFWDKAVYFTELYMAGYKFVVSPDGYLIHFPHHKTHTDSGLGKCSRQWYRDWLSQKKRQYGYKRSDVY